MISSRCDAGSDSILLYRSDKPLLTLTPKSSNSSWCLAKASL
ncbi:Uncharacterised protein [Mycobacterium tuberculosis]|nr:Uncharacterised protein [Mycobacterium tuberculosis]